MAHMKFVLIGFTPNELAEIGSHVPVCKGELSDLMTKRPKGEFWFTHPRTRDQFLEMLYMVPGQLGHRHTDTPEGGFYYGILFPHGLKEDDYPAEFTTPFGEQIELDGGGHDCLSNLYQCGWIPYWQDQLLNPDIDWFNSLPSGKPTATIDQLPLPEEDKIHLKGCSVCFEEVASWLNTDVAMHNFLVGKFGGKRLQISGITLIRG